MPDDKQLKKFYDAFARQLQKGKRYRVPTFEEFQSSIFSPKNFAKAFSVIQPVFKDIGETPEDFAHRLGLVEYDNKLVDVESLRDKDVDVAKLGKLPPGYLGVPAGFPEEKQKEFARTLGYPLPEVEVKATRLPIETEKQRQEALSTIASLLPPAPGIATPEKPIVWGSEKHWQELQRVAAQQAEQYKIWKPFTEYARGMKRIVEYGPTIFSDVWGRRILAETAAAGLHAAMTTAFPIPMYALQIAGPVVGEVFARSGADLGERIAGEKGREIGYRVGASTGYTLASVPLGLPIIAGTVASELIYPIVYESSMAAGLNAVDAESLAMVTSTIGFFVGAHQYRRLDPVVRTLLDKIPESVREGNLEQYQKLVGEILERARKDRDAGRMEEQVYKDMERRLKSEEMLIRFQLRQEEKATREAQVGPIPIIKTTPEKLTTTAGPLVTEKGERIPLHAELQAKAPFRTAETFGEGVSLTEMRREATLFPFETPTAVKTPTSPIQVVADIGTTARKPGARFAGYQELKGVRKGSLIATYQIDDPGSAYHGSIVTRSTLERLGYGIPYTPEPPRIRETKAGIEIEAVSTGKKTEIEQRYENVLKSLETEKNPILRKTLEKQKKELEKAGARAGKTGVVVEIEAGKEGKVVGAKARVRSPGATAARPPEPAGVGEVAKPIVPNVIKEARAKRLYEGTDQEIAQQLLDASRRGLPLSNSEIAQLREFLAKTGEQVKPPAPAVEAETMTQLQARFMEAYPELVDIVKKAKVKEADILAKRIYAMVGTVFLNRLVHVFGETNPLQTFIDLAEKYGKQARPPTGKELKLDPGTIGMAALFTGEIVPQLTDDEDIQDALRLIGYSIGGLLTARTLTKAGKKFLNTAAARAFLRDLGVDKSIAFLGNIAERKGVLDVRYFREEGRRELYFSEESLLSFANKVNKLKTDKSQTMIAEHYSLIAELEIVDPKFMGTGLGAAEMQQVLRKGAPKRMTFYVEGEKPGPGFENMFRYFAKWENLYNADVDPRNFFEQARGSAASFDRMVKRAGFSGYMITHGDSRQVIFFEPVEVAQLQRAYQMYRENVKENLTFAEALEASRGDNQQRFLHIADDIDKSIGLTSKQYSGIGVWTDGAENSVLSEITGVKTFDDVRYSAAWKGKLGNQKSVIAFLVDKRGNNVLYSLDVPSVKADITAVDAALTESGIAFKTLIESPTGTRVLVLDMENTLQPNILKFGDKYAIRQIQSERGTGEFIGGNTREEGRRAFDGVIESHERTYPDRGHYRPITEAGEGVHPTGRPTEIPEQRVKTTERAAQVQNIAGTALLLGGLAQQFKTDENGDNIFIASLGGSSSLNLLGLGALAAAATAGARRFRRDPKMFGAAIRYIKKGEGEYLSREEFDRAMTLTFGERVQPHLETLYNEVLSLRSATEQFNVPRMVNEIHSHVADAVKRGEIRQEEAYTVARERIEETLRQDPRMAALRDDDYKLILDDANRQLRKDMRRAQARPETDVEKQVQQFIEKIDREIDQIDAIAYTGTYQPKEIRPSLALGKEPPKRAVINVELIEATKERFVVFGREAKRLKDLADKANDPYLSAALEVARQRFDHVITRFKQIRAVWGRSGHAFQRGIREAKEISEYLDGAKIIKQTLPPFDQLLADARDTFRRYVFGKESERTMYEKAKNLTRYLQTNLFTLGTPTLDMFTNTVAAIPEVMANLIIDVADFPRTKTLPRTVALYHTAKWNILGLANAARKGTTAEFFRLSESIERELGPEVVSGEFLGTQTNIRIPIKTQFTPRGVPLDYLMAPHIRLKAYVDRIFGRFFTTTELYAQGLLESRKLGLKGKEQDIYIEDFVRAQTTRTEAGKKAIELGRLVKFNVKLSQAEEKMASSLGVIWGLQAFPRWGLQFIRFFGRMMGLDPSFWMNVKENRVTRDDIIRYFTRAATGWGGIILVGETMYDRTDFNTMHYEREDGTRVRLSGRTPLPEVLTFWALSRGDYDNVVRGLPHTSFPFLNLAGMPGLFGGFLETAYARASGTITAEKFIEEITEITNRAVPGQAVLSALETIFNPAVQRGFGANIPGASEFLPSVINPTTGEPLVREQIVPFLDIRLPAAGGIPIPGTGITYNEVEREFLRHGISLSRPRRSPLPGYEAEDVPKELRQRFEQLRGQYVWEFAAELISHPDYANLTFDQQTNLLLKARANASRVAKQELMLETGEVIPKQIGTRRQESLPLYIRRRFLQERKELIGE